MVVNLRPALYSTVRKDFVEALPRNKGNKTMYGEWNDMWINKRYVYSNVPLSQATKKKSKSPGNEDNVSMCF